ncbi:MAG TPA: alpha/beta hydrolase [Steroidobacteraceae bacterium]|nr:alpha/beta hydrolase [Steroidobacteraceae bacterium]
MASSSYHLIEPDLRPALAARPPLDITAETLAMFRGMDFGAVQSPPGAPVVVERRIPGPLPGSTVRVLIIDPAPGRRNRPALLHLHGGGYVVGAPENANPDNQRYAMQCGCVVVSVDYQLAPETVFPGALEDNYAALRWLHENAESLGVDPRRIGVGGESAGGGHAAALAIAARDRGQLPVAFQFLVYPMLDDRTGTTRKVSPYIGEFIWTAVSNQFGWSSLLGVPAGSKTVPQGAVPARVGDLRGLPPAFIGVGALDLFIEEDLEYAGRLIAAGVPVEVHVAPGAYHGFDKLAPETVPARHFTATLTAGLGRLIADRGTVD